MKTFLCRLLKLLISLSSRLPSFFLLFYLENCKYIHYARGLEINDIEKSFNPKSDLSIREHREINTKINTVHEEELPTITSVPNYYHYR